MGKVETVKISDGEDGYIVINKSDFDEETHVLFEEDDIPGPSDDLLDIVEAIGKLNVGDEADFTTGGNPRVARIEEILERDVTAVEVNAAWATIKEGLE